MSNFDPIIDENFRQYAELQRRRHLLLIHGMGREEELDTIDDRLDEIWDLLDAHERQSVNGMASDLNWVRRKGELPPKGRKPDEVTSDDRKKLDEARAREDWHGLLHSMRVCASTLSRTQLAYDRGRAYEAIGLQAYADIFQEFAAELAPSDTSTSLFDRAIPKS